MRLNAYIYLVAALFCSPVFCSLASGQGKIAADNSRFYNQFEQQLLHILLNKNHQKELELSEKQIATIKDLNQKLYEGYREIYGRYPELRDSKLDYKKRTELNKKLQNEYSKLRKEFEKEVLEHLVPSQTSILRKLNFKQTMNYYGLTITLTKSPFAEELETSESQRSEIMKIKKQAEAEILELIQAKRAEAKDKMLKLLSAKQRKKFKELEGDSKQPNAHIRL